MSNTSRPIISIVKAAGNVAGSLNPAAKDGGRRQQKQACFFAGQTPFSLHTLFWAQQKKV